MINLLEAIENSDENAKRMVLTVLAEEHLAEKALAVNGSIVWESRENGFFSFYKEEIAAISQGGEITLGGCPVFCDVLGKQPQIVICGGGHVSIPVIKIGIILGFEVTVLEDRPLFADNARRAGASWVICEPFSEGLDKIEGNEDTYFVIVTRGHRYDQLCLEKIAGKGHAYIGMIGSRRRTAMVKEQLIRQGADQAVIDEVYTPIGLDIGARTPEEIAVAIAAELIEVKNKRKRTFGYSKEVIQALSDKEAYPGDKVLATIVRRKGSAPQEAGAKMVICRDSRCIGTIGGGCMEADVIRKAVLMMNENEEKAKLCHIDLLADAVEEEGMVCGGTLDVLLERIETED